MLRQHAASLALGLAGFTWITSAVAFTLVEDVGEDGRIHSFGDALWWSAATITTVGYGDIAPVTFIGRVVGVFTDGCWHRHLRHHHRESRRISRSRRPVRP